ncbi:hypothetical protein CLLI_05040 [Clostridium liquoris]|jgi:hypothetical protein|uniref:DUF1836 domain-containing protein n=1 Tax=Clostridium liquoris TaxID=1289519 RepID=A0A2T0B8A3_9CLOT|nr:DUF1836 domain-containing protein [Clostridium liquoris]PRR80120.1 hypothetical protein CLLI_05040 [Clostridium liquoris]
MEYNRGNIDKLFHEIVQAKEIAIEEIPCIDLYMDQVTTFFEDKLSNSKRNPEDKILTKTMINNYTKGKILMPAKKKKYTTEHMILLILIYNLKQGLSINDINTLFNSIFDEKTEEIKKNVHIDEVYKSFLRIKTKGNEELENNFNTMIETIEEELINLQGEEKDLIQVFITVLVLIDRANSYRRTAEKVIDNFVKD